MPSFNEIIGQNRPIRILQSILQIDRTQVIPPLLFTGDMGIGKRATATIFIQALFCTQVIEGNPCGTCLSCQKIQSNNHPDIVVIEPDGASIKIDQIRGLQERIVFTPIAATRKIFLIDPADKMTIEAQNSLLKTIEEPPPYALLILISSKPALLAPTLVSRCQTIAFSPLSLSQIESLLVEKRGWTIAEARLVAAFTGGRLGEALTIELSSACKMEEEYNHLVKEETLSHYDTLFAVATTYSRDLETFEHALYYLSAYFRDLLVLLAVPAGTEIESFYLVFSWRHEALRRWAARMNPQEVAKLLANITVIQQTLIRNINKQLALETILMQMRDKLL